MKFTYSSGQRPLDGFTIKCGIGKGGFGEVYYALSDGGKEVALKLVHSNLDVELRGMSQCLNLKHPNLVNLYDLRKDALGNHWVIMEYVLGESLSSIIQRYPGGIDQELVRQWFTGLAGAVGYLHDHGIVHRDLKPGNIFLEHGAIKVCDYGLSKVIGGSQHEPQTQSVGTVHYMAPEISSGNYNRQIDIYAAGVILYEMLTGRVPFDGESAGEILMKHLTVPPDLSKVPLPFVPILDKALAKNPSRRYQSVVVMARDVAGTAAPPAPALAKSEPATSAVRPLVLAPAPEPSRSVRRHVGELCGSLVLATLLALAFCLVWGATGQAAESTSIIQCFLLTVACSWGVLIPAKIWTKPSPDSWSRRLVLLGLGLLIGVEALWLAGHSVPFIDNTGLEFLRGRPGLQVPPELVADVPQRPVAPVVRPNSWLDRLFPANSSLPLATAFMGYYSLTFLMMPWWKLVERSRLKRFQLGPVFLAAFWAFVFLFLLPRGREREIALLALVMTSVIVQFASPWERPQPARTRPVRLRYA